MKETKALIRLVAFCAGLMTVLHCAGTAMAGEWCDEWNTQTLPEKQAYSNPEQQMNELYKAAIRRGISCIKANEQK
jgi:hypothetical protein